MVGRYSLASEHLQAAKKNAPQLRGVSTLADCLGLNYALGTDDL